MNKKNKQWFIIVGIVIVVVGVIGGMIWYNNRPGPYDNLAICIKNSGATFYGAFWCSHCQNQKREFGNSARLLPYVECSTPDGQGTTGICKEKGIQSYPTWIFADGSQQVGELTLQDLADKTHCPLK